MELSERIQIRMREKGWRLADLARETKIAKGYLWEILSGKAKRPSASTLYEIARALGTSIADLLGREADVSQSTAFKIPTSLRELVAEENIPQEDVQMLVSINFRGEQPKTKDDWKFLYESIRRSVRS